MVKELTPEEIFKVKQDEMVAMAVGLPSVILAATTSFNKTVKWAETVGITSNTAKPIVPQAAKDLAVYFDANFTGTFNKEQWNVLKELFEMGLNISIPVVKMSAKTVSGNIFINGIAVKFTASKHGHKYPLNEVTLVNVAEEMKGIDKNGITPATGLHFDPEPSSIQIATQQEILETLAQLYVTSRGSFEQFSAQANEAAEE